MNELQSESKQSNLTPYYQNMNQLFNKGKPYDSIEKVAFGYENYLQGPVQSLGDNLESLTYEVCLRFLWA